jgi:peptide/nickel transport system substrate-binding protein
VTALSVSSSSARPSRRVPAKSRAPLKTTVAVTALFLTACGGGADSAAPEADGPPRKGGTMTMYLPGDAVSLDPFQTSNVAAVDGNRLSALYDVLVWTDPATGTVNPQVATSLTPSSGGAVWTLQLNSGVAFNDGTPYDAEAVRANWLRHQQTASPQKMAAMSIKSMKVTSPLTLEVTLQGPNANFDRTVARSLSFIASPKSLGSPDSAKHPVGAGPYRLTEWAAGDRIVMDRNPAYWQKDKAYLDRLVFKVAPETMETVKDFGRDPALTLAVDPREIAAARDRDLNVDELHLNGGFLLEFNTKKPPFDNPDVRRAVTLALSSEKINADFYAGHGAPARGVFSAESNLANTRLAPSENHPEEAKALFAKITANGSKPLNFSYSTVNTPVPMEIAGYFARTLNAYPGVHVSTDALDIPAFVGKVVPGGAWDSAINQLWIDDPEPGVYDLVHTGSPLNRSGYSNPVADKALADGRASTDTDTRREAYTRLQVQLNQDLPFWAYQEASAAAVSTRKVTGLQLAGDGVVLWDRVGLRP